MAKHRKQVERFLGRKLSRYEIVHHINGISNDNRLENFYVFPNHKFHNRFHQVVRDGTISLEVLKSNLQEIKEYGGPLRKDDKYKRCEMAIRGKKRMEIVRECRSLGLDIGLSATKFYDLVTEKLNKAFEKDKKENENGGRKNTSTI